VLHQTITRMTRLLMRRGSLLAEQGSTPMADNADNAGDALTLGPLQASACHYPIALGPGAGQKVLVLQGTVARRRA
jgi:hypothetical protein